MDHLDSFCSVFETLQSPRLGSFELEVRYRPKTRIGHFDFEIYLRDTQGQTTRIPIIWGIYSFDEEPPFRLGEMSGLDEVLFGLLGKMIVPGGLLIVSCITDLVSGQRSEIHALTRQCLGLTSPEIPAACTPLGWLLFMSGCRNIRREAYDVQGSNRLAGEMAPNADHETKKATQPSSSRGGLTYTTWIVSSFTQRFSLELKAYLGRRPHAELTHLEEVCRANAGRILDRIMGSE